MTPPFTVAGVSESYAWDLTLNAQYLPQSLKTLGSRTSLSFFPHLFGLGRPEGLVE